MKEDDESECSNEHPEEEGLGEIELLETWVQWKQRTTREALEIMDKLKIPDWADEQRRRLWRWAGHTARRQDGRWSRQAIFWTPDGTRNRGRPKKRWEDPLV